MISDVPGDDPAFIASGPTVGDASTPADALAIIERYGIDLPDSAKAVLSGKTGVIPPGDERLSTTTNTIIAAPSQSLEAARAMAEAQDIDVTILGDDLEGEARDLARATCRLGGRQTARDHQAAPAALRRRVHRHPHRRWCRRPQC
jgi:glycerate 2-kinase